MMEKRIYLDYGAATPVREEVQAAMRPYLGEIFANPSALYQEADRAKEALDRARETIARVLQVRPQEVVFTASSTESNNLAILGRAGTAQTGQMVSTGIEHSSIGAPLAYLASGGWDVTLLPVDGEGRIEVNEVRAAISKETALITLAWANTDIGVLQPIEEIADAVKDKNKETHVHIDASQAGTTLSLVTACKVADSVTISPAKMYGPHGVGILVVKKHAQITPYMFGGAHERSLRPGTEFVAGAVGAAVALEKAQKEHKAEGERLTRLRDMLFERTQKWEDVLVTGSRTQRLAHHASFAVKSMDGEELAVRLDVRGFAVGTGSACTTGEGEISEAVRALGIPAAYHAGTIRVTLGKQTQEEEVRLFADAFEDVLDEIRSFNE